MKPEIKALRQAQKFMDDLQYPGYPFQLTVVIDLEEKVAWVNHHGRKQPLKRALAQIWASLLYQCLSADNTYKQSFLVDQHLEDYKKYLDYDYDQFEIDHYECCKFYFALNSAIYSHKKTDTGFIFACVDEDTEWAEVQCFYNLQEIEQYIKDYFSREED